MYTMGQGGAHHGEYTLWSWGDVLHGVGGLHSMGQGDAHHRDE